MSIEWICIKNKLPNHNETILVSSLSGFAVCIFLDSIKTNKELKSNGFLGNGIDVKMNPYNFCSQEIKGHVLNNVTHWCYLDKPKIG